MKLSILNADTLPKMVGGGNKLPCISFNKAGTITINQTACTLMDINPSDKVSLAEDTEDPGNWYVFKSEDGFQLRSGYDKKGLMFNHAALVKKFLEGFDLDPDLTHQVIVAGKPTVEKKVHYWGLLKRSSIS